MESPVKSTIRRLWSDLYISKANSRVMFGPDLNESM